MGLFSAALYEMEETLEIANRSIKRSTERNATQRDVVAMNVKGREACGCLE